MAALRRKLVSCVLGAAAFVSVSLTATLSQADTPYVGEIRVFGFDFCPNGWLSASGLILPISQNTALFSLMGTFYGGNGSTTFQLIDARGRAMTGAGQGQGLSPKEIGEVGGQPATTLLTSNLPAHSHLVNANNLDGDKPGPGGKLLAAAPPSGVGSETIYSDQPANVTMATSMLSNAGGSQPLPIADPSLGMTVCIATQGIYPSRP